MLIQLIEIRSQIQCSGTIDFGIKTAKDEDNKPFLEFVWSKILRSRDYLSCLSCMMNCEKWIWKESELIGYSTYHASLGTVDQKQIPLCLYSGHIMFIQCLGETP